MAKLDDAVDELAELVTDAWRALAPKAAVEEYDRCAPT